MTKDIFASEAKPEASIKSIISCFFCFRTCGQNTKGMPLNCPIAYICKEHSMNKKRNYQIFDFVLGIMFHIEEEKIHLFSNNLSVILK